jgi:hypothetical protein
MPAITILRVSIEDQKIAGNSLPAKEKRIVKLPKIDSYMTLAP